MKNGECGGTWRLSRLSLIIPWPFLHCLVEANWIERENNLDRIDRILFQALGIVEFCIGLIIIEQRVKGIFVSLYLCNLLASVPCFFLLYLPETGNVCYWQISEISCNAGNCQLFQETLNFVSIKSFFVVSKYIKAKVINRDVFLLTQFSYLFAFNSAKTK